MKIIAIIGSPHGLKGYTGRLPDEDALFARARSLGAELVSAIRAKRHYPALALATFSARMEGLVTMMQVYWPFEREVWQGKKSFKDNS